MIHLAIRVSDSTRSFHPGTRLPRQPHRGEQTLAGASAAPYEREVLVDRRTDH